MTISAALVNKAIYTRRPLSGSALLLIVWAALVLIKVCFALQAGKFGQIGIDSDDVMRLVQIRDFLGGQGWTDMHQYRLGGPGGTLLHWSRLVDLPIIGLISIFDLFMPYASAEALAISIWPPLTSLLVIWGISRGAGFMGGHNAFIFGLILSSLFVLQSFRFAPGSIDHHNLQFGLLALAIGYALDPKYRRNSGIISGGALALSLGIGAEIQVFAAIICLYMAGLWVVKSAKVKPFITGFSLALSAGLAGIFFALTAPANYGQLHCDSLSYITVIAAAIGGGGLAAAALGLSQKNMTQRLGALALLGGLCAALLIFLAPQCLSNPLNELPPIVRQLWLEEIIEAQPLLRVRSEKLVSILFMIGVVSFALIYCLFQIFQKSTKPGFLLMAGLLASMIAFTFYQVRFYPFGHVVAMIALSAMIAQTHGLKNAKGERRLVYIAVFALSIPVSWIAFGSLLTGDLFAKTSDAANAQTDTSCYSSSVMTYLDSLAAGRIAAASNAGSIILYNTGHSALNGNYHRNSRGIHKALQIFTSPPERAEIILAENQVDYVLFCREGLVTKNLKDYAPAGLTGQLMDGKTPAFLTPMGADLENGAVTVYRVSSD